MTAGRWGGGEQPAVFEAVAVLATAFLVFAAAAPVAGQSAAQPASRAQQAVDAYEQLQAGEYAPAVQLPSGGVEFALEVGTWHLESGTVRVMRPVALAGGERTTGVVFQGVGRFRMAVPDAVELDHLRRSTEDESLDHLDVGFDQMVFRFSQPQLAEVFAFAAMGSTGASSLRRDPLAADRHEHWLERRRQDLDARVVAARLSDGDAYLRAAMKTKPYGWIEFVFDALEGEEISLAVYRKRNGFVEEWVRLDRAADRQPDGRPTPDPALRLDLLHLEVAGNLTRAAKTLSPVGKGEIQPRLADFEVTTHYVAKRDLGRAVSLALTPLASVRRVERITTDGPVELPFLRHQLGKTVSLMSEKYNDWQLVVLLDEDVTAGEELRLRFDYELEVLNYVADVSWHPGEANAILDRATADLRLLTRKKDEVRAMGTPVVEGEAEGDAKRWHYRIERPARMLTFSFAETFHEETVTQEGVPDVTAFASYGGRKARAKAQNVAADVSNSIEFFQQVFRHSLPTDHLYATAIYGNHGQSFDGFLHLAERTFLLETNGPSQLFRAHEAAHQWWGHTVSPATYRDYWLSEALAEYSAILFLQVAMEGGQEVYDEVIAAYTGVVRGRFSGDSRFLRGWAMQDNDKFRRRVGPIGLGIRAATSETPSGYFSQTYVKGTLVLHMLRTCMRSLTQSDEAFFLVLQDFLATFGGRAATTADFVSIVEKHAPGEWDWFFDQWIQGTAIPTYRWSHEVRQHEGKTILRLDIEQEGVPPGFRMPVPVQIAYGKGPDDRDQVTEIFVLVDTPRKQVEIELPKAPRKVILNSKYGVLADVKKR